MTGITASPALSLLIGAIIFACSSPAGFGQGSRWSVQDSTGGSYVAASALDTLHCLAAGSAGGEGIVRRTTDGGRSWSTVLTAGTAFTTVSWPAPDLCLAAGTKETIWRSTDGGTQWSPIALPFGGIRKMSMDDSLHGMAIRVSRGVAGTTDGGVTWSAVGSADVVSGEDIAILSPASAGVLSGRFYHVGAGGDVGAVDPPQGLRLDRLAFTDSLDGWSAAEGSAPIGEVNRIVLLHTTDGGEHWMAGFSESASYSLASLTFAGKAHGLAGGMNGRVLQTTDGGVTWMDDLSPVLRGKGVISDIAYPMPGVAWAVTSGGYILRGAVDRPAGVGTETISAVGDRLDIWPNPSRGSFTIGYATASHDGARLRITDLLGREIVPVVDVVSHAGELRMDDLPAGTYFIRLRSSAGAVTRPVTVVR